MEEEYLAFVDNIGKTLDGQYIYRLDFTQAPDIVWGEGWNIVPCSIIPNIQPDSTTISSTAKLICNEEYLLAKNNSCFSMQDCIDGIIALLFTTPQNKNDLMLKFGENIEVVNEKLNKYNFVLVDFKNIHEDKTNEIIDATLDALGNNDDNGIDRI